MKRYFTILNILLITTSVYLGVKAFYKITTANLDQSPLTSAIGEQISSPEDETYKSLSYYKTIIERNLFNTKTGTEKKSEGINIEALKQTELNLKLLGTVTGDRGKAYAVIEEEKGRRQNLYRVGDIVQTATVKMILREKIVLNVNGKDEILEMEKPRSGQKKGRSSKILKAAHSQSIALKSFQIDNAIKNVNNLMKQVRIRPHFENGKPHGFVLSNIKPNSIFKKMGLKSGDVITGVDGKDIESMDDVMKFYKNLKLSSNVNLQIKRRGRPKTINYKIE